MHSLSRVLIQPGETDDSSFIVAVEQIVNRTVRDYAPRALVLVQIDRWFGSRWLEFSGKSMGVLGVRKERVTIPPFVPSRVISQRRFLGPSYDEVNTGESIHVAITAQQALSRYLDIVEPDLTFVWFSGDSINSKRAAIMVYAPTSDGYATWYASFEIASTLRMVEMLGITGTELGFLLEQKAHGPEAT